MTTEQPTPKGHLITYSDAELAAWRGAAGVRHGREHDGWFSECTDPDCVAAWAATRHGSMRRAEQPTPDDYRAATAIAEARRAAFAVHNELTQYGASLTAREIIDNTLAAALPLLRAQIADELVEYARNGRHPWYGAEESAVLGAADFVKRGGTDA